MRYLIFLSAVLFLSCCLSATLAACPYRPSHRKTVVGAPQVPPHSVLYQQQKNKHSTHTHSTHTHTNAHAQTQYKHSATQSTQHEAAVASSSSSVPSVNPMLSPLDLIDHSSSPSASSWMEFQHELEADVGLAAAAAAAAAATANVADPLIQLNLQLQNNYNLNQEAMLNISLADHLPVVVASTHSLKLFLPNPNANQGWNPTVSASNLDHIFHQLKLVSHLPFSAFVLLQPSLIANTDPRQKGLYYLTTTNAQQLQDYLQILSLQATKESLSNPTRNFTTEQIDRSLHIYTETLKFLNTAHSQNYVTDFMIQTFINSTVPSINQHIQDAATITLNNIHRVMMEWKQTYFSNSDNNNNTNNPGVNPTYSWDSIRAIVLGGSHMARDGNMLSQYFSFLFSSPISSGTRVIYAESAETDDMGLPLLSTHLMDFSVGQAFWYNPEHMHSDILAPATHSYLTGVLFPNATDPNAIPACDSCCASPPPQESCPSNTSLEAPWPISAFIACGGSAIVGIFLGFMIARLKQTKHEDEEAALFHNQSQTLTSHSGDGEHDQHVHASYRHFEPDSPSKMHQHTSVPAISQNIHAAPSPIGQSPSQLQTSILTSENAFNNNPAPPQFVPTTPSTVQPDGALSDLPSPPTSHSKANNNTNPNMNPNTNVDQSGLMTPPRRSVHYPQPEPHSLLRDNGSTKRKSTGGQRLSLSGIVGVLSPSSNNPANTNSSSSDSTITSPASSRINSQQQKDPLLSPSKQHHYQSYLSEEEDDDDGNI